jgi:peroxiredoxin
VPHPELSVPQAVVSHFFTPDCVNLPAMLAHNLRWKRCIRVLLCGPLALVLILSLSHPAETTAQAEKIVWSDQEKPILDQIRTLRKLPDAERARTTKQLALQIRQLPTAMNKVRLANTLANLSTEGDPGKDTLQDVATTLAAALRDQPVPSNQEGPASPYIELAQLTQYEHVQVTLEDPQFAAAESKMKADDLRHEQADFALSDLKGKSWALRELRGNVVLVNFWATWCPPCRSEMPDLESLHKKFKKQGLTILGISDEDAAKVKPFVDQSGLSYAILLDPGRKVHQQYDIEGIPKSFVYDRDGKLVAHAIDMRTKRQFLEMLAQAGLR